MKWRRTFGRMLAIIAVVIVIGVIAGYFYLTSNGFRQFALRKIIEQANAATGGHTQIRNLDLNLSTVTAHLRDVVIHGNEPSDAPPLLQIDELTVGLKIQSVFRRKINLSELLIEHPVAYVQVDHNGNSNIPHPPSNQSSSHTNIFDLAVRHAALTNGEVNYNDRKTLVDADLHNLTTNIVFDPLATRYRGTVSYDNGHIQYGQHAPLPHNFNAKFNATPSLFSLESAVMKVASSTLTLRANATNYSDPTIDGDYDIRIHTQDFAALSPAAKPAGDLTLAGNIRYQNKNNQPLLRSIAMDGQFGSEILSMVSSGEHIDLRKMQGKYQLVDGSLRASDIEVESFGGRINADVAVQHLDRTPSSQVQIALHNISLQAIQKATHRAELNRAAISGTLNGSAVASWTGSVDNIRAHSDLTLRAAKNVPTRSATDVPVAGVIHAIYDGPENTLTVHQTTLRIPSATLTAEGQVSRQSSLQIHATVTDLHQLTALISSFRSSSAALPLIAGSATLNATVRGSIQKSEISGQVNAQNLGVQGSEWKSAQFSFQVDPSRMAVSKGSLVSERRGAASFNAAIGLHNWSYLSSNPIQANLSLQQMSMAELEHLANVRYTIDGELSANISMNGSQLEPKGSGSLGITKAHVFNEPIQAMALKFHTENGSIISTLNITANAGSAKTSLTYTPKTKAYKLHLDAPSIILQNLRAVQAKNLAVNGTLSVSASGEGTLDNPQLTAIVQLPRLDVRQKSVVGIKAEVHVANKQADLMLDSQIAQASVRAHGHINLSGDYETDASLDTAAIPLDALLATYTSGVPEGFQGQTEFHAIIKGPLKDKAKLEAHLTIPALNASYQSLQIGAAGPIRVDYAHSVVTLQPAEIRGTGTSVRMQGSIPATGTEAPTFTAQGSIDARILRIVSPDVRSSGTVALDIRTSGTSTNPQVQGQVRLQNIAMETATAPLGISKLNGTLDVGDGRVQISNMTGEVGGGQVSAGGAITYRPSLQFNIALQGNSIRLRYPDGLRTLLDSNLAWTGNTQASTVTGRVLIGALSFTPDFDLATFGDQFSSNVAAPAQPGFADTVGLQIAIQSKNNLSANSSQVSLEGTANLRVAGTVANPVITGRTDLTAGELFYRSVRYQMQHGIITFNDPNQTKPVLNVSVSTIVEQYNLTLNLRGPFDTLTVSYVSDPPLATADIINLIARGKTSSELAASSQSTDSMIASQAASQVSGNLQKLAGISSLQIDPLLGGNNQNPSARIGVQQRVTKNFLFNFSTDVSQPGNEVVQGDYQITKRWSVSVGRDQLGGVSVDGRFHTKF